MMPFLIEILGSIALFALSALAPFAAQVLRRWADLLDSNRWLSDQQRLGNAAARIAARISAELAARPEAQLTMDMVERATVDLAVEFRQTVLKRAIPRETLQTIALGELAKLGRVPQ